MPMPAATTTIQCPRCGAVQRGRADASTVCHGCGVRLKPPAPTVNHVGNVCWREGSGKQARIVMLKGASTPDRCVRCNAAAHGYRKRMKFYETVSEGTPSWAAFTTAAAATVGAGAAASLAVQLTTRQSAIVHLAVCPECRRKARIAWSGALPLGLLALAAVLAGSLSFAPMHPNARAITLGLIGTIGGAALLVASVCWAVSWSHLIQCEQLAGGTLWFKPNGRAFVDSLPEGSTYVSEPPAPPRSWPAGSW